MTKTQVKALVQEKDPHKAEISFQLTKSSPFPGHCSCFLPSTPRLLGKSSWGPVPPALPQAYSSQRQGILTRKAILLQ